MVETDLLSLKGSVAVECSIKIKSKIRSEVAHANDCISHRWS